MISDVCPEQEQEGAAGVILMEIKEWGPERKEERVDF